MKELFWKYQKSLLKLANDSIGRKLNILGISKEFGEQKIDLLLPNAWGTKIGSEIQITFRTYSVFQYRLKLALSGLRAYDSLLEGIKYYLEPRQIQEWVTMCDTTGDLFSGSGDGRIFAQDNTWNTVHDAATGINADITGELNEIRCDKSGGGAFRIHRSYFPWDISSIGGGNEADSAIVSLWVISKDDDLADGVGICEATPATPGTIIAGDFDQMGDVDNPTEFATRIDLGSISTGAYNNFTVNAAGLTNIDAHIGGTYWEIASRMGKDMSDSEPATGNSQITVYFSERTGTANDPKLVITFSTGGAVKDVIGGGVIPWAR